MNTDDPLWQFVPQLVMDSIALDKDVCAAVGHPETHEVERAPWMETNAAMVGCCACGMMVYYDA